MKDFDLQAAKKGAPVCTRDGHKARIVCFDIRNNDFPIIAVIDYGECEGYEVYTSDGKWYEDEYSLSCYDLMMADIPTIHHEGWINIKYYIPGEPVLLNRNVYPNETMAKLECANGYRTVKIEWEDEV